MYFRFIIQMTTNHDDSSLPIISMEPTPFYKKGGGIFDPQSAILDGFLR